MALSKRLRDQSTDLCRHPEGPSHWWRQCGVTGHCHSDGYFKIKNRVKQAAENWDQLDWAIAIKSYKTNVGLASGI